MTIANLMDSLHKYYPSSWDLNQAVRDHRKQNENWNWVDAALDLLNTLEAK